MHPLAYRIIITCTSWVCTRSHDTDLPWRGPDMCLLGGRSDGHTYTAHGSQMRARARVEIPPLYLHFSRKRQGLSGGDDSMLLTSPHRNPEKKPGVRADERRVSAWTRQGHTHSPSSSSSCTRRLTLYSSLLYSACQPSPSLTSVSFFAIGACLLVVTLPAGVDRNYIPPLPHLKRVRARTPIARVREPPLPSPSPPVPSPSPQLASSCVPVAHHGVSSWRAIARGYTVLDFIAGHVERFPVELLGQCVQLSRPATTRRCRPFLETHGHGEGPCPPPQSRWSASLTPGRNCRRYSSDLSSRPSRPRMDGPT